MALELEVGYQNQESLKCNPQCVWKCDSPQCKGILYKIALCDPVCEQPICRNICEKPLEAVSNISCDPLSCKIVCPNDACAGTECPKCKPVCADLNCISTATVKDPVCKTECDKPICDWKCNKPTDCQKPVCELHCQTPSCAPSNIIKSCKSCANKDNSYRFKSQIFHQDEQNPYCCKDNN